MKNIIRQILNQIQVDKAKRRQMRAALLVLSLLVATGVVWQLKITGITMTGEALCGYLEHQHTEDCEGKILICEKQEVTAHLHDDNACYKLIETMVCTDESHEHDENCFTPEEKLICQQEETEGHAHSDACYESKYICDYESEHIHTVRCYSDTEADLETSGVWESTLPVLTGKSSKDLAAVAASQLGYTESQYNYKVADDGVTKMGYTRYGEWYGNPYGNWSAMFVSFCLNYAEHPAYEEIKSSGVETMRQTAQELGYCQEAGYAPEVGDLVFLDKNADEAADTVAVVSSSSVTEFTAIEGDCENAVQENSYSLDMDVVMSFAQLPENNELDAAPADASVLALSDAAESATVQAFGFEREMQLAAEETSENITVSFVIDKEDYTGDNGTTHITATLTEKNNPSGDGYVADGGLIYTYWTQESGKYKHKITGTGTLMTYTIPAGTAVSQSGYSLPNIGVANITGSTLSFMNARSWVTAGGIICNADTVFAEDTTLYLSLYQSGKSYTLNWVCNCTGTDTNAGRHSVYSNLSSSYPNATFTLGESLSAPYILTAEDVNSTFTGSGESCNVGSENGKTFTGWYLKKEATGEEIEFGAGVPLLEEYTDPNSDGYVIKVYARWEDAEAVPATVTFVYNDVTEGIEVTVGSTLRGHFPDTTPVYTGEEENMVFAGWKIWETGEVVTADTVVTGSMTLIPVFEEGVNYEVFFHDIDPDGNEVQEDGTSISLRVTPNTSVADWLDGNLLDENTAIEDCIWYTVAEDGTKTVFDLEDTPITKETHLYTYSYKLQLMMNAVSTASEEGSSSFLLKAGAVEVTVGENGALTMVLREGEKPTAADFVVNGVDYTLYTWTAEDDTVDISKIIANGVTENITATSDGSLDDITPCQVTINFYVCIDGVWTNIQSGLINVYSDNDRYHLTVAQLEEVYGKYGFNAGDIDSADDYLFAHVDSGGTSIYSCTPKTLGAYDTWFIPLLKHTGPCDVYYLPANSTTASGVASGVERENYVQANSFYSIIIEDEKNLFYKDDEIPAVSYVFTGETATVTLLTPDEDITWQKDGVNLTGGEDNGDGTTTYTFTNVRAPVVISSKSNNATVSVSDTSNLVYDASETQPSEKANVGDDVTITVKNKAGYDWLANGKSVSGTLSDDETTITYTFTNVTEDIVLTPVRVINTFTINYSIGILPNESAISGTRPTIKNDETYADTVNLTDSSSYIVLTPDRTQYTRVGDNSLVTVVFKGWDMDGDGTVDLEAGQVLTAAELSQYGNTINLTAVWEDRGYQGSVSFYINLELQVLDYDGSTEDTSNSNFTGAIYGTEVLVDPAPATGYQYANVLQAAEASKTAQIDAKLRTLTDGVTATYMDAEREFTLMSFPDDENALAQIRQMQQDYITAYQAWVTEQKATDASADTSVEAYRAADNNADNNADNKIIWDSDTGEYIPLEEITSENYTIRWYVFKYDRTNGWHVDGVLVKKQGQLTVTKTFYGYDSAVTDVKEQLYAITVKDASGNPIYTLNLDEQTDGNANGWVAHDPATDTYTWTIPLTVGQTFKLFEENYTTDVKAPDPSGSQTVEVASLSEYMITNDAAAAGRLTYDDTTGVSVVTKAYANDLSYTSYQTVKFYNSYIPTNTMLLNKVDDSGRPLANVTFQLLNSSKAPCSVWKSESGTYFIYDPNNSGIEATQITTGYITTDSMGNAVIIGLADAAHAGTYSLREVSAPSGYSTIEEDIEFEIKQDGTISVWENPYAKLLSDDITVRVTNTSEVISVTAKKVWTDNTNEEVKVNLCLEGTPMDGYEVALNADNNWTYTWEDLPAYVGGSPADYTIRETWIGSSAYSGTIEDGYENYVVTYSNPVYTYDADGSPTSVTLTVTNRKDSGEVEFTKVDHNNVGLKGAVFQLYSDADCTTAYGSTATSEADGKVSFGNLAAGVYYMKEIQAPDGYQANNTIYEVTVTGSGTTIKALGTETAITTIANIPANANLLVQKVDSAGKPLTDATFELYIVGDDVANKLTIDGKNAFAVDEKGQINFTNLANGDYLLRETSAPAGYYRLTEDIPFTISLGKVTCTSKDGAWDFTDDNPATITVINVPGSELPETGGVGTHFGTMVGLLMMAGSLLYGFLLRRKRERGAV